MTPVKSSFSCAMKLKSNDFKGTQHRKIAKCAEEGLGDRCRYHQMNEKWFKLQMRGQVYSMKGAYYANSMIKSCKSTFARTRIIWVGNYM